MIRIGAKQYERLTGGRCFIVTGKTWRPAAMLLEVLISVGLLVAGMAFVGAQINAGLKTARETDIASRAMMLVDYKLAQLQSGGLFEPKRDGYEEDGDFGIRYPGFTWRISFNKVTEMDDPEGDNLFLVKLEIGYNGKQVQEQIDNADLEIEFDDKERIVQTVYYLWPAPATVNLERDYGVDSEELEEVLKKLEEVGDTVNNAADELEDGDMPVDTGQIIELLRDLLSDPDGFDPREIVTDSEYGLTDLLTLIDQLISSGGDIGALNDLMKGNVPGTGNEN